MGSFYRAYLWPIHTFKLIPPIDYSCNVTAAPVGIVQIGISRNGWRASLAAGIVSGTWDTCESLDIEVLVWSHTIETALVVGVLCAIWTVVKYGIWVVVDSICDIGKVLWHSDIVGCQKVICVVWDIDYWPRNTWSSRGIVVRCWITNWAPLACNIKIIEWLRACNTGNSIKIRGRWVTNWSVRVKWVRLSY